MSGHESTPGPDVGRLDHADVAEVLVRLLERGIVIHVDEGRTFGLSLAGVDARFVVESMGPDDPPGPTGVWIGGAPSGPEIPRMERPLGEAGAGHAGPRPAPRSAWR